MMFVEFVQFQSLASSTGQNDVHWEWKGRALALYLQNCILSCSFLSYHSKDTLACIVRSVDEALAATEAYVTSGAEQVFPHLVQVPVSELVGSMAVSTSATVPALCEPGSHAVVDLRFLPDASTSNAYTNCIEAIDNDNHPVAMVGVSGCGKTATGAAIARQRWTLFAEAPLLANHFGSDDLRHVMQESDKLCSRATTDEQLQLSQADDVERVVEWWVAARALYLLHLLRRDGKLTAETWFLMQLTFDCNAVHTTSMKQIFNLLVRQKELLPGKIVTQLQSVLEARAGSACAHVCPRINFLLLVHESILWCLPI